MVTLASVASSIDVYYMQQINKIIQPFPDMLLLCYFGEPWKCSGMPDQTQQRLQDLTKASMDI